MTNELPAGLEHVRTTETFDRDHHPAGLRRAHRVADNVWARLLVHTGTLDFAFENDPDHILRVGAGRSVAIPPGRLHHVDITGPVTFALEFHRQLDRATPDPWSREQRTDRDLTGARRPGRSSSPDTQAT